MFLSHFDPDEKRAFLHLSWKLIHIDGVLAAEEETMFAQCRRLLDLEGESIPATIDLDAAVGAFTSHQSRVSALLELLALCHADGDFHPAEQALVRTVANGFGVSAEALSAYESWVLRQVMLMQEAEAFWSKED